MRHKLKINRVQIPLAPAFAITAHASQGQTLDAAIVDLCISKEASPITSYVALTQARRKEDIAILRPFDRSIFQKVPLLGPHLLLKHLRSHDVDWEQLQELLDRAAKKRKRSDVEEDSDRKRFRTFREREGDSEKSVAKNTQRPVTTCSYCQKTQPQVWYEGFEYCNVCALPCSGCNARMPAVQFVRTEVRKKAKRTCVECGEKK